VLVLYGLINLAMLRVLPVPQLAASNLAVADAAAALFGAAGRQGITVLALVSLVGLINASIMAAPRVLYGLARDGMITPALARVNAGGTPSTALLLTTLASVALVLTGSFSLLLGMAAFLYVALYLSGFSALLSLRWREPDAARPYRAWGSPWSVLIVLAGSLAFLLGALLSDPGGSLWALALIAASLPLRPWLGGSAQESPP
jgi:APA family basic amino acid/polyamine antiporter